MKLVLDRQKKAILIATAVLLVLAIPTVIFFTGMNKSQETGISDLNSDESLDSDNEEVDNPIDEPNDVENTEEEIKNNTDEEEKNLVTDGEQLVTDLVEEGSINILFLGEDVGNSLMDTIGVASIDKKAKKVKVMMFPRDTYIQYSDTVLEYMDQKGILNIPGSFKINFSYWLGHTLEHEGKFDRKGVNFVSDVIHEKFGIEIDDYIRVNTRGFVQLVDLFDGVDIYVPYDMNYEDPDQDLYIHLDKGLNHLNGEQAEGFVRYRKGTDRYGVYRDYGDVERKKNQVYFLKEFYKQHATLRNVDKIPSFINFVGNNLWSSIKVSDVLFRYTGILKDVIRDKYEIETTVLSGTGYKTISGSSYVVF